MRLFLRKWHEFSASRPLIQRPNRISKGPGWYSSSLVRWKSTETTEEKPLLHHTGSSVTAPFNRSLELYGRKDILTRLEGIFTSHRRAALIGIDGIGKSAIAINYAQEHLEKHPGTSIFWVQSSSAACFSQSYSQLADTLKLTGRHDHKSNVLKLVCEHLSNEQNGPWLLVLDDVDNRALLSMEYARRNDSGHYSPLSSYLPKGPHGSILITSHDRSVAEKFAGSTSSIITVHALDEADSITLLRQRSRDKDSPPGDAKQLANCLDSHPLALTQAAAYISKRLPKVSITKYVSLYRKPKSAKIHHIGLESPAQALSVTWKRAFDRILKKHPDSFQLLSLMSVFHYDAIPARLLEESRKRYKEDGSNFEKDVIEPLLKYSLITHDGDKFCMHSLVQQLTRSWLRANNLLLQRVREALTVIVQNFPDSPASSDNWRSCQLLLPHAQAALSIDPGPENPSQRKERGKLLFNIAYFEYVSGDHAAALRHFISAKQILSEVLKPSDEALKQTTSMINQLHNALPRPLKKTRPSRSRTTKSNKAPEPSKQSLPSPPRPRRPRHNSQRQPPPSNPLSPQNILLATLCITMTLNIGFTFELKAQLGENEEGDEKQDSRLQSLETWLQEINEGLEKLDDVNGEDKGEERGEKRRGRWEKWVGWMWRLLGWG